MSAQQARLRQTPPAEQPADPWAQATAAFDSMVDTMTKPSRTGADEPGALPANTADQQPGRSGSLSLEGSTSIPDLGMTFAQALEKWRELGQAEREADDQEGDAINLERGKLAAVILATEPVTPADALVLLELLADPETGLSATSEDPNDAQAIQRAFAILSRAPAGLIDTRRATLETSVIPLLNMTFRQAADRVRELLEWNEASAARDPYKGGEEERQRVANTEEWRRLNSAIADTLAGTIGDVLVKLERLACPQLGAGAFETDPEDINAIADDLCRIGGGGSITAADAELVSAFRQFVDLRESFNGLGRSITDEEEAEEDRLRSLLADRRPQTMAGALAQLALVLRIYMGDSIFDLEDPENSYARALHHGLSYFAGIGDPSMKKLFNESPTGEIGVHAFWRASDPAKATSTREEVDEEEEGAENAAIDLPASGLSPDEIDFLRKFRSLDRDGQEAILNAGRAVSTLDEAVKLARKAGTVSPKFIAEFAECMREDADRLDPQQPQQPAAFSVAVAAFQGAAPAGLCIPDTPTDAMLEAGATAGGINLEQARAIFTAMAEAYRREAA